MGNTISILANLRVAGAIIIDKDVQELPPTGKLGTFLLKGTTLYAYVELGGMQTWYPLVKNLSKTYTHTQILPSMSWTVNHKFGSKDYWFAVKDNDGNYQYPMSVEDIDNNNFKINFAEPIVGIALVVGVSDLEVSEIQASLIKVGANVVIDSAGMTINGKRVLTVDGGDVEWTHVKNTPTTKTGYGLTDVANLNGDLAEDFNAKIVNVTDIVVSGNVSVAGERFLVNANEVSTKENTILLNKGEPGAGVTAGFAGIAVDRGSLPKYQIIFDEVEDMFKVGLIGDLETIASQVYVNDAVTVEVAARNTAISNAAETAATIKNKLGIATLSGVNTGDETITTIKSKLGVSALTGSNTGDETNATILSKLNIGSISGVNTGDQTNIPGNAATATKLATLRNVALTGDIVGSATFDGSNDLSIACTIAGDKVGSKTFTGAITCNYATDGSYIAGTVTGPTTLTIAGVPDATKAYGMTFELTNAGTNVTWPASVVWLGTAPTLRASGVSMVTLVTRNGGTTWYGSAA